MLEDECSYIHTYIHTYLHRHTDGNKPYVGEEATVATIVSRAETLGIVHEGYSIERILGIMDAVMKEWRAITITAKRLSLRYW